MTEVITALTPEDDSALARSLGGARSVRVVRRCADVAELLAVADAGIGDCAVVSADLRGLDLSTVGRLRESGVAVVGVHDDEGMERRLRQLSIVHTLKGDAGPAEIESVVAALTRGDGAPAAAPSDAEATPDVPSSPAELGSPSSAWVPAGLAQTPGQQAPGSASPGDDATLDDAAVTPDPFDLVSPGPASSGTTRRGAEPPRTGPSRGVVVAVWGPLGAPGRTTVAVNLAAELAGRGLAVLLVDADTYGGCVAQTLGLLDEAPGLTAAARAADHGSLDVPALARLAPQVVERLRVLTGIPRADRWPEVSADALDRVLELSRSLAAVTVVDCGFCLEDDEELSYDTHAPRRNAATLTALAAADRVVAVGAADAVSLQRFVRGLQQLGTVPCPPPVPLVNRVRVTSVGARPRESLVDVLHRFAGLDGIHLVPEDRDAVDAALLAARTVVEHAPDSPFRRAIAELATVLVPTSAGPRPAPAKRWGRRWRHGRSAVTA